MMSKYSMLRLDNKGLCAHLHGSVPFKSKQVDPAKPAPIGVHLCIMSTATSQAFVVLTEWHVEHSPPLQSAPSSPQLNLEVQFFPTHDGIGVAYAGAAKAQTTIKTSTPSALSAILFRRHARNMSSVRTGFACILGSKGGCSDAPRRGTTRIVENDGIYNYCFLDFLEGTARRKVALQNPDGGIIFSKESSTKTPLNLMICDERREQKKQRRFSCTHYLARCFRHLKTGSLPSRFFLFTFPSFCTE